MKQKTRKFLLKIKPIFISLFSIFEIILDKGMCKVPILVKLKMNFKGYVADRYVIYNIKENDIDDYISEFEVTLSKRINRQYCLLMDDKLLLTSFLGHLVKVPEVFGVINQGKLRNMKNVMFSFSEFLELLKVETNLIIKPIDSGGGKNIRTVSTYEMKDNKAYFGQDDFIFLNNRIIGKEELFAFFNKLDQYIVTEYVKQHQYAKSLYEFTVNTIRLITIQDPYQSKISIPIAVQRIGRDASFPVDNFDKGGLSVEIDIETGILGRAASRLSHTKYCPIFYDKHPDTGAQITGIRIPFWNDLKRELIETASHFPYLYFIAWDVVITNTGFTVVEINKSSGSKVYQVFGGQKNKSLGDFYRFHGIIK